jgi:hypothetical protein
MNHYVPLFEQIVDSSIWCESDLVVKVFLTLLAKRKKNGIVYGNAFNIAQWAKKTESEVLEALAVLAAPDRRRLEPQPYEGRRIEKVEGGWLLLNAEHYQKLMVAENKKHANARAQAKYAARQKAKEGEFTNLRDDYLSDCSTQNNAEAKVPISEVAEGMRKAAQ